MTTAQELFDEAWDWFVVREMPRAITAVETSMYRMDDGRRCAAGVCIRDDEYRTEMEGVGVDNLHRKGMLPEQLIPHVGLLSDLQWLHDRAAQSDEHFRKLLRDFAADNNYGVTAPGSGS